jgi:hypothetical protein
MKQISQELGITQQKHRTGGLQHRETKYCPKIFMESLNHKQLNKWCGSDRCTKNMKTWIGNKKTNKKWYIVVQPLMRPHFDGCAKTPNAGNFSYNCKNTRTTSDAGPIIRVSFAKEGKTQVEWVVIVRCRTQKWTRTNNVPPNGSTYHVLNFNKMTMRSPWWETWEKYCGDGRV